MAVLSPEEKSNVIAEYQRDPNDTGSPEVQIAVLTHEIRELTEHLKIHKHDFHSQRGLMKKVGRRKRLMKYLLREDPDAYRQLIDRLQIRG
ncbi:MAG: 30S ribosomal protein S15 [Candidatus Bipolaricaulia bacterium]